MRDTNAPMMPWQRLRVKLRYRWSRVRSWAWRLFHKPRPLPTVEPECEHEVEPTEDPDWGRCRFCGDASFPMTERAAYGDPDCRTCMDTGLVPAEAPGRPQALADARCPDCSRER